jgi:transposase
MIPHGVEIFMAVGSIDVRWGFARLSGVVNAQIGRGVRCGALFFVIGRRRDALKILFFDGSGLCLFYKRLDDGVWVPETLPVAFRTFWPVDPGAGLMPLTAQGRQGRDGECARTGRRGG